LVSHHTFLVKTTKIYTELKGFVRVTLALSVCEKEAFLTLFVCSANIAMFVIIRVEIKSANEIKSNTENDAQLTT